MSGPHPDPHRDAETFLRWFHARDPGCTRRGFGRGKVIGRGGSTYELVAAHVPVGARVLEIGCGDGALLEALTAAGHDPAAMFGIDLSAEELAASGPRAVAQARAQALPIADDSLDAVVSHLVLMLVPQLDPVIAELARV